MTGQATEQKVEHTPHFFILIASHLEWEPYTRSPEIVKVLAGENNMWLASEVTPYKREYDNGDRVLLYAAGVKARTVIGDALISGPIDRVTAEDEEIAKKLGLDGFVQRIPLTHVRIWDHPLPLAPIVDRLKLIKDVRYWGQHFRQGAARISKEDYLFILKEAGIPEP